MATPNLMAVTTVTPKILSSSQLASGDNTVYTVPASKAARIAGLTLCNTSAAPVVVSVAVIPSGGAVDGTHRVVSGYSLAAGDSTSVSEVAGAWLGAGDFLSINAGAASAVDVVATGIEFA